MAFLDNDGLQHLISTIKSKLDLKSDKTHIHDDRYYTETEMNTKLDAKANANHTHNYAGSSSAGGAAKQANSTVGFTTAGTGAAYTVTVDGITSLASGTTFTMIPHTVSTTTAPTINVNSLGAKNIRMRVSNSPATTTALPASDFLTANKPVKLLYDGTYWIVDDMVRPNANALYGTVPVSGGGTGATDAATARANLGLELSASGNRFGVVPNIGADGVMEVGKYIDFHNTDGDTSDYAARMTCNDDKSVDFSNGITSGGSPILTMQSYILKNVTIAAGSYNTQTMTINVPTGYYALGTLGYYLYNTSQGITMTRCFITAKTNKVYVNLYNSSSSSKKMSGESWVKVLFVKQEMVGTLQDPIAPASYS